MKSFDFLRLLLNSPRDAYGRLEGIADSRLERFSNKGADYETVDLKSVSEKLCDFSDLPVHKFLNEPPLAEIEGQVQYGLEHLPENAPFHRSLNGDFALARLCYALCRALRPSLVVETGVCYGVTSAFFLHALSQNGKGVLHSIDLPPLGRNAGEFVGKIVPEGIRSRWTLHRGASKTVLPRLLRNVGPVDFFIHDSLHTYRNMRRELSTITPHLAPTALVLSDDIECNSAFREWTEKEKPSYWAVLRESSKDSLLGLALFRDSKAPISPVCSASRLRD
jgi:hypothetical protein